MLTTTTTMAAAVVAVFAGVKAASAIVIPLLLAAFIAYSMQAFARLAGAAGPLLRPRCFGNKRVDLERSIVYKWRGRSTQTLYLPRECQERRFARDEP